MAIDYTSPEGKVRLNIGDVTEPYMLPDDLILALLLKYEGQPENFAVYYATVDSLLILKGRFAMTAARRREREGGVEIEEYSAEKYQYISDLLDYWKDNPPDGIIGDNFAPFIFGGVSKKEYDRVKNDPDSVGVSGLTDFQKYDVGLVVTPDWRIL